MELLKGIRELPSESRMIVRPGYSLRTWNDYRTVPVTRRDKTWYLHVLPSHRGKIELYAVPEPDSVKLLRDGTLLKYSYEGKRVSVTMPKEMRTGLDDVVAVGWKEEVGREYRST